MENKKKLLMPIIIICSCAIVYFSGVIIFSARMMPGSFLKNYVSNYDISWKGRTTLNDIVDMNDHCTFTIHDINHAPLTFELSEVKDNDDIQVTGEDMIQSQSVYLWPVEIFFHKNIVYDQTYPVDIDKLKEVINSFDFEGEIPSQNAEIATAADGTIYIKKEVYGTQVDRSKLRDVILEHIKQVDMETTITDDLFIKPEITANDHLLQQQKARLSKITDRKIMIDMTDATESVSAGYFLNTDTLINSGEIEIDEERVNTYVDMLMGKYNTYGQRRSFTTHDKQQIKVGATGDLADDTYGFSLDWYGTRDRIIEALGNTDLSEIEASWNITANARGENGDIGDTYIEISIDDQHLWYFEDGDLIFDAPVVTGLPTANRHTPKGVYGMFWKGQDVNLKGELDGDKWDTDVDYWLSVTWTGVGIHSAPWQPSFGGDTYMYRGSHGCINISTENCRWLYEHVDYGTCIVIY